MLRWQGFTVGREGMWAFGLRGRYQIRLVSAWYVLTGVGHDDLPMLVLPPWGRKFPSLAEAQAHAERIESVRVVEPEVSGC